MPIKMAMFKILAVRENNTFLITLAKCWSSKRTFTSKSQIEEAIGCPEKPKAPINSFLKFFINYKSDYAVLNNTNKCSELTRIMSKVWKEMSEEERKKYIEEYNNEKLEYKEKLEAYLSSFTETQKQDIINLKEKLKHLNTSTSNPSKEKLKKSLNKPMYPLPPFGRFFKDLKGVEKFNFKEVSEQWKKLPESERKKYTNEFQKEIKEYAENLKKWEFKMIKEGNIDVLSAKTIKKLLQYIKRNSPLD